MNLTKISTGSGGSAMAVRRAWSRTDFGVAGNSFPDNWWGDSDVEI